VAGKKLAGPWQLGPEVPTKLKTKRGVAATEVFHQQVLILRRRPRLIRITPLRRRQIQVEPEGGKAHAFECSPENGDGVELLSVGAVRRRFLRRRE
jgi:hypothetical protein